ncbi:MULTISPECIES: hypothetical protein [Paenibacillus]|nr:MULTISPECIES: hypothetical protein [Paenibacillus]EGL16549.1 hypothetical protein HMPREF9413_1648 [Paenibacillus sp. HGF7]EPD90043.1 hypothetical protein HMPREF1207_01312 [Paenibacillus sp. HGH0039]MBV6712349.1 hypothetical protein [Paenibacillus chitinolyticus]
MKRYYFFDFPIDLIFIVFVFVVLLAALAVVLRKGGRYRDGQKKRGMD